MEIPFTNHLKTEMNKELDYQEKLKQYVKDKLSTLWLKRWWLIIPYFDDKLGFYNKLAKYCEDNGLKINYIISELIQDFLIQEKVIEKKWKFGNSKQKNQLKNMI